MFGNKSHVQYAATDRILELMRLDNGVGECYVPNYPSVYLMDKKSIDESDKDEDEDEKFITKKDRLYLMLEVKYYESEIKYDQEKACSMSIVMSNEYLVGHRNDGHILVLLFELSSDLTTELFEVYYNPITTMEEMEIMLELLTKRWIVKSS